MQYLKRNVYRHNIIKGWLYFHTSWELPKTINQTLCYRQHLCISVAWSFSPGPILSSKMIFTGKGCTVDHSNTIAVNNLKNINNNKTLKAILNGKLWVPIVFGFNILYLLRVLYGLIFNNWYFTNQMGKLENITTDTNWQHLSLSNKNNWRS